MVQTEFIQPLASRNTKDNFMLRLFVSKNFNHVLWFLCSFKCVSWNACSRKSICRSQTLNYTLIWSNHAQNASDIHYSSFFLKLGVVLTQVASTLHNGGRQGRRAKPLEHGVFLSEVFPEEASVTNGVFWHDKMQLTNYLTLSHMYASSSVFLYTTGFITWFLTTWVLVTSCENANGVTRHCSFPAFCKLEFHALGEWCINILHDIV